MNRRRLFDPMLSMINVVFLLIAFFLFGRLEPPIPVAVDLPIARGGATQTYDMRLFVDDAGRVSEIAKGELRPYSEGAATRTALVIVDANTSANIFARALANIAKPNLTLAIEVLE